MTKKLYLDAQQLLEDSFKLAAQVLESAYRPSFIVAVWRGGAPMGIAVQELLDHYGIQTDHIAIRTSSYTHIDNQSESVQVYNMNYLTKNLKHTDRLLIVDDVFDTGRSVEAIIDEIKKRLRRNTPEDIRLAVPYYKPTRNKTGRVPDYYLYETEQWLKFPHSVEGLTTEEVKQHRPELYNILRQARIPPDSTKNCTDND